jgi:hypothetical protein
LTTNARDVAFSIRSTQRAAPFFDELEEPFAFELAQVVVQCLARQADEGRQGGRDCGSCISFSAHAQRRERRGDWLVSVRTSTARIV